MTMDRESWSDHATRWRDPAEAVSLHRAERALDWKLLTTRVRGDFWGLLEHLGVTLLVGREYEHFVMAMTVHEGRPLTTYMPLPHPSGIAVDRDGTIFIASTRNPNQVFRFRPLAGTLARHDRAPLQRLERPLMPMAAQILPGSLYVHDLAVVGGALHASATGQNAVVRITEDGFEPAWWPRCIERRGVADFGRNYIQLNSIAAGRTLEESFFTASGDGIEERFPGDRDYPVDRRGVIFSGATREPVVRGLTRPHSARLWRRRLWVNNSGYGELGTVSRNTFVPVVRLPGWTRGLAFRGDYAFVGVSRVIPRFRAYAPGLNQAKAVCGVFVVQLSTGKVVASIVWPRGNQIFAVELIDARTATGFPYRAAGRQDKSRLEMLFYAFRTAAPRNRSR